jgi:hypothetical protein
LALAGSAPVTYLTEAPQTGDAGGAAAASQSDPGPVGLDERIVAAFGDASRSDEVGRLLVEVEAAAKVADGDATEPRMRALDPLLCKDAVADARRQMADSEFVRDRLTEASKRLGERLNELRAIEKAKAQRAEHEAVAAERERLAMELEHLAEPMAEVAALVAQIDQVERNIKLLNVSTGPVLGYIRPTLSAASPVIATLFGDGVVWDALFQSRPCGHRQLFLAGQARRTSPASGDQRVCQRRFSRSRNGYLGRSNPCSASRCHARSNWSGLQWQATAGWVWSRWRAS